MNNPTPVNIEAIPKPPAKTLWRAGKLRELLRTISSNGSRTVINRPAIKLKSRAAKFMLTISVAPKRGWGGLERVSGIEPPSSPWKGDILAVVLHPLKSRPVAGAIVR